MSRTKFKVIENNNNMDKENRNKALDATVSLIEKNYGKDDLLDHLLDDWLEAEMQEEAEAEGWL